MYYLAICWNIKVYQIRSVAQSTETFKSIYIETFKSIHISFNWIFVAQSCPTPCNLSLQPHRLQYARLPYLSLSPGVCSNSCPLSQWCHPTIWSRHPFSSCPQSFPAWGSFQMSQLFASGGQSIGVSASTSVLPMNIHGWCTLGLTALISVQSKGLSRVFSSTIQLDRYQHITKMINYDIKTLEIS